MYGRDKKNILPIKRLGTTNRNLDFIFCDFIKHPIASIIKDKISNTARIITITLNPTNRMVDNIFSILLI